MVTGSSDILAKLHPPEVVMTPSQLSNLSSGAGSGVSISIGELSVSGVQDPERAADLVEKRIIECVDRGLIHQKILQINNGRGF